MLLGSTLNEKKTGKEEKELQVGKMMRKNFAVFQHQLVKGEI